MVLENGRLVEEKKYEVVKAKNYEVKHKNGFNNGFKSRKRNFVEVEKNSKEWVEVNPFLLLKELEKSKRELERERNKNKPKMSLIEYKMIGDIFGFVFVVLFFMFIISLTLGGGHEIIASMIK